MKNGLVVQAEGSGWYKDGLLHRIDGPAWIDATLRGSEEWYFNGKLHRTDGPAAFSWDGTAEWWVRGQICFSHDHFKRMANLSNEEMFAIVLVYGHFSDSAIEMEW